MRKQLLPKHEAMQVNHVQICGFCHVMWRKIEFTLGFAPPCLRSCYCLSSRGWEVSLILYPSTAEDSVSQFVRLTLTLTLDQQVHCQSCYPAQAAQESLNE